jgi:hypothetical protein
MRISRQFPLGMATGASLVFILGFVTVSHPVDQSQITPSYISAGASRLTFGMKESDVLEVLGKAYNLRKLGNTWWATEKGQTNRPALTLSFQQGDLAWAQKQWFDEHQPRSGVEVLSAVSEIMSDFAAQQHSACTIGVVSQDSKSVSVHTRETELRCGDLQLETILTTDSGRDAQVEVNEVLAPAHNANP